MKRNLLTAFMIGAGLLLVSCQKDMDQFIPDPGQSIGPDTAWYGSISIAMPVSLLRSELLKPSGIDTIHVNALADSVRFGPSATCGFPPFSCVTSGGLPVTGQVTVEWSFVKTKGDMIRMNRPNSSYNRLLVNGGQVFISLKKDGQVVQLAPGVKLGINCVETNNTATMDFFAGMETFPGFTWQPNPDVTNNNVTSIPDGYKLQTNRLGWTSYAYFFDTTGLTRSRLTANLPANYTNANTILFVVFDGQATVIDMMPDVGSRKFISPLLPDGKAVSVIAISKQEDDYYFTRTPVLINGLGTGSQAVNITPQKKTLPEILALLSAL